MLDARAAALATSDVAFFSMPPRRPSRSGRRPGAGRATARRLVRAIRRELARAAEEAGTPGLPRITRYPY
ncbi:MAG: hypothetical protein H0U86_15245 [Chloroflexi bacterium]|nr:hypothetical protein [Chloroflexota bacterium]